MVKATNLIVSLHGWRGSGKTTTLALFLYLEHLVNPSKPIFSNFKLNFDFQWLNGRDMVDLTDKLKDSAVGIDELHEYCDSRNSGTLQNKRVADFFLQSRHTQSNCYYTTQFLDQIDKRIRRITDITIVCENLFTDLDGDGEDDTFQITLQDRRYPETKIKQIKYYAKPIFEMFDSREKVNPFIFLKKDEKAWRETVAEKSER